MTRPGTLRITRDIVRIFEIIASPGRGNGTLYVVAKTKQNVSNGPCVRVARDFFAISTRMGKYSATAEAGLETFGGYGMRSSVLSRSGEFDRSR